MADVSVEARAIVGNESLKQCSVALNAFVQSDEVSVPLMQYLATVGAELDRPRAICGKVFDDVRPVAFSLASAPTSLAPPKRHAPDLVRAFPPDLKNDIVYTCLQCQAEDTCVMCQQCFNESDHEGHEISFHKTSTPRLLWSACTCHSRAVVLRPARPPS